MIKFFNMKELEAVGDKYGCLDCPYYTKMNCPKDEYGALFCIGGYFREVPDEDPKVGEKFIQDLVLGRPKPTPNPNPKPKNTNMDLLDEIVLAILPPFTQIGNQTQTITAAYEFAARLIKIREGVKKNLK